MKFGKLNFTEINTANSNLVSEATKKALENNGLQSVLITEIDPKLSDTAEFCDKYQIDTKDCANCVLVKAVRGDRMRYAAVMIDGNSRADINGVVRKHLDARKISFAPMSEVVELTGMEFGAITPIGLPKDWMILVDTSVAKLSHAIIGSGIRESKLLVSGELLANLPNTTALNLKRVIES